MPRLKLLIVFFFAVIVVSACVSSKPKRYVIAESKAYEASLFRQNCAICHGPEGEGRTLDEGREVLSGLSEGEKVVLPREAGVTRGKGRS